MSSFSFSSSSSSSSIRYHSIISWHAYRSLLVASSALIFDYLTSEIHIVVYHSGLDWWLMLPCSSRWWNWSWSILNHFDWD
jgi:hypothetical protein